MSTCVAVLAYCCFAAASLRLIVLDLRDRRLPNRDLARAACSVVPLLVLSSALGAGWSRMGRGGIAALVYAAVLVVLGLLLRGSLGGGDVKLAPLIGLVTGWLDPAAFLCAPLGIAVCGGASGIVALARRQEEVAFGPAMLIGSWSAIVVVLVVRCGGSAP